ncbi:MAG: hypothetical protein GQ507_01950 [Dehalococcoidales bacterium]|nr:hypothetical protein [Dehalococcoidales bacterium]
MLDYDNSADDVHRLHRKRGKCMPQTPSNKTTPLRPIKWYKMLATSKGRREAGVFLIEGDRAIRQIIESQPDEITEIITKEEMPPVYSNYPRREVTESQFRTICLTKTPQGPLAVVRMPQDVYSDLLPQDNGSRVLLLEDIQDPGNVGTLIRTAAAFDYTGVILSEKCADPLSPKCVQATAGSTLSLWLRRTPYYLELAETLKKNGYSLAVAELGGIDEPSVLRYQDRLLLALGNEASGPSPLLLNSSDYRIRIAIAREKAESLNVAACGAICIYLSSQK